MRGGKLLFENFSLETWTRARWSNLVLSPSALKLHLRLSYGVLGNKDSDRTGAFLAYGRFGKVLFYISRGCYLFLSLLGSRMLKGFHLMRSVHVIICGYCLHVGRFFFEGVDWAEREMWKAFLFMAGRYVVI